MGQNDDGSFGVAEVSVQVADRCVNNFMNEGVGAPCYPNVPMIREGISEVMNHKFPNGNPVKIQGLLFSVFCLSHAIPKFVLSFLEFVRPINLFPLESRLKGSQPVAKFIAKISGKPSSLRAHSVND
jgi:hypothetical protein